MIFLLLKMIVNKKYIFGIMKKKGGGAGYVVFFTLFVYI